MSKKKALTAGEKRAKQIRSKMGQIKIRCKAVSIGDTLPPDFVCHFSTTVRVFQGEVGDLKFTFRYPMFLSNLFQVGSRQNDEACEQSSPEGYDLIDEVPARMTIEVHPNGDVDISIDPSAI